jgi:uncharacterized protein YjbI with pentapeptide repeats/outer membrane protein assembly factor BamD (BamD/ComL family)
MSNPEHLARLHQGTHSWNAWRTANPDVVPDLSGATLTGQNAVSGKILSGPANLRGAHLQDANLSAACLAGADLTDACLADADLRHADFSRTTLALADFSNADLMGARFEDADLLGANLTGARLSGADLKTATGLTLEQIASAYSDATTALPPHFEWSDPGEDQPEPPWPEGDARYTNPQEVPMLGDPYAVLGVDTEANALEIRAAYLKLAKKCHPDVNRDDPEAEQRFSDINEAYRLAAASCRMRYRASRWTLGRIFGAAAIVFVVGVVTSTLILDALRNPGATVQPEPATQRLAVGSGIDTAARGEETVKEVAGPSGGGPIAGSNKRLPLPISPAGPQQSARPDSAPMHWPAPAFAIAEMLRIPLVPPAASPPTEDRTAASGTADDDPLTIAILTDPSPAPWVEEWKKLRGSTDLRALYRFIERYPDRAKPEEAWKQFRVAVAGTTDADDLRSLQGTLRSDHPEAAFIEERLAMLVEQENKAADTEAWLNAKDAGSIAAFRAYLVGYPTGRYADNAHQQINALEIEMAERRDNAAWMLAKSEGTVRALSAYLRAYPNGRYAADARESIADIDRRMALLQREDRAWEAAKRKNSRDGFHGYLKAYPKGRYAAAARDALQKVSTTTVVTSERHETLSSRLWPLQDRQRRKMRWPSSDEPFIDQIPGPGGF